jgi:predicted XRE-type DNA-binding protein
MKADDATIHALRSDLALQIARHVSRSGESQVRESKRLRIPQPTLSKIMNGRIEEVSLELLIRIAVRAGLPVVLQTGTVPEEAGVFVSMRDEEGDGARLPSRVAEEARDDLIEHARRLSPTERLEAHVRHTELVTALHRAGRARSAKTR